MNPHPTNQHDVAVARERTKQARADARAAARDAENALALAKVGASRTSGTSSTNNLLRAILFVGLADLVLTMFAYGVFR